jgi:hypothetical protein
MPAETTFSGDDLKALVDCAGRALEYEDRYLTGCAYVHGWTNDRMGIRANTNERLYQFIIWRALMSSFPWRPDTEKDTNDFVFYRRESKVPVGRAEIKGWWGVSGQDELPGIRRDMNEKLANGSEPGVMLILTSHKKRQHDENLRVLARDLEVDQNDFATYAFDTPRWPGETEPAEFMVIGFLVAKKVLEAAA